MNSLLVRHHADHAGADRVHGRRDERHRPTQPVAIIDHFSASLNATPLQLVALDRALLQFREAVGARDGSDVHRAAAGGMTGTASPLPHLDRIQQSFGGHDLSHVKAYSDPAAERATNALGARAYATDGSVVLGPHGRDLHTVAHEAAHVVQQQAGVSLSGGVGAAGDAYERHADQVAALVVAGKSAEQLLGPVSGSSKTAGPVQCKEDDKGSSEALRHKADEIIRDARDVTPLAIKLMKYGVKLRSGSSQKKKAGHRLVKFGVWLKTSGTTKWIKAATDAKTQVDLVKSKLGELRKLHKQVQAFKQVLSQVAVKKFVDDPSLENAGLLTADLQQALNTAQKLIPNLPLVAPYLKGVLGAPAVYLGELLNILSKYVRKINKVADMENGRGKAEVGGIGTMTGEIAIVFWRAFGTPGMRGLAEYIYKHRARDGNLQHMDRTTAITRLHHFLNKDQEPDAATWMEFLRNFG